MICFQIFDTNLVLSQRVRGANGRLSVVICFQIFDTNLVLSQHTGLDKAKIASCDLLSDF